MQGDIPIEGIRRNVLLKEYTTFKIGGPAQYFFEAKSKQDIIEAVSWAKRKRLPFFILGGGSNLLVSDRGFNGLVIKIESVLRWADRPKLTQKQIQLVEIGAGVKLADLVKLSAKQGLTGFEWAGGIPESTVGGAIRGNAAAFGNSMRDIVRSVEVFDVSDLTIKNFQLNDCKFFYKESIFKKNKNLIILSCILELKKGQKKEIEEKIKFILNYRKENHPMSFPSAGSVFKNVEASPGLFKMFPELAQFNEKGVIPAAYLIEKCGLKGKKIGDVAVSPKHANFIVNLGGGRAEDVLKLISLIKKEVRKKFGIELQEEITILSTY